MEHEEPQNYDILVLDAFSSDAIPVHLLTVEAFEIYRKHLAEDGILAVHISNRHFELEPVVEAIADHFGMAFVDINSYFPSNDLLERSSSEWVLVSPSKAALDIPEITEQASKPQAARTIWTDDRNNLFQVLREGETLSKMKRNVRDWIYGAEEPAEIDESESTESSEE